MTSALHEVWDRGREAVLSHLPVPPSESGHQIQLRSLELPGGQASGVTFLPDREVNLARYSWQRHDSGPTAAYWHIDPNAATGDGPITLGSRLLPWAGRPVFYVDGHDYGAAAGAFGVPAAVEPGRLNAVGGHQLAELVRTHPGFLAAHQRHGDDLQVVLVPCVAGHAGNGHLVQAFADHLGAPGVTVWASPHEVSLWPDGSLGVRAAVEDPAPWLSHHAAPEGLAVLRTPDGSSGFSLRDSRNTRFYQEVVLPPEAGVPPGAFLLDARRVGRGVGIDRPSEFPGTPAKGPGQDATWSATELAEALPDLGWQRGKPVVLLVDHAATPDADGRSLAERLAGELPGTVVIGPRGWLRQHQSAPTAEPSGAQEPNQSRRDGELLVEVLDGTEPWGRFGTPDHRSHLPVPATVTAAPAKAASQGPSVAETPALPPAVAPRGNPRFRGAPRRLDVRAHQFADASHLELVVSQYLETDEESQPVRLFAPEVLWNQAVEYAEQLGNTIAARLEEVGIGRRPRVELKLAERAARAETLVVELPPGREARFPAADPVPGLEWPSLGPDDTTPEVPQAPAVPVITYRGNGAFQALTAGLAPLDLAQEGAYRFHLEQAQHRQLAYVVNAIFGHHDVGQIRQFVRSVLSGAEGLAGRVAFVLGVNAKPGGDLRTALRTADAQIADLPVPVAITGAELSTSGAFPYGRMRNELMRSQENLAAVSAFLRDGRHPYLAVQDFDMGSRLVPSGRHVFEHFESLLGVPDAEQEIAVRPLLFAGGYRVGDLDGLMARTAQRLRDSKEPVPDPAVLRARAEEFQATIAEDMTARVRQARTHPLLPYAPEPNLFLDALPVLRGDRVRFGQGASEFTELGKTVNEFYASELAEYYRDKHRKAPAEVEVPVTREAEDTNPQLIQDRIEIEAQLRIDAENNKHPLRGTAFVVDFIGGATDTDLSRVFKERLTTGKTLQHHADLTGPVSRFHEDKSAKDGVEFADYRKDYQKWSYQQREPLRPRPGGSETAVPGQHDLADGKRLGTAGKNSMSRAISTPIGGSAPFNEIFAGIAPESRWLAAHNLAISAKTRPLLQLFTFVRGEGLNRGTPRTDGLFHAVTLAAAGLRTKVQDAAWLRERVIDLVLNGNQTQLKRWAQLDHAHNGDLLLALLQPRLPASVEPPSSVEGEAIAYRLITQLVADALKVVLVIDQPGADQPHEIAPSTNRKTERISLRLVLDQGRHDYFPRRDDSGKRPREADETEQASGSASKRRRPRSTRRPSSQVWESTQESQVEESAPTVPGLADDDDFDDILGVPELTQRTAAVAEGLDDLGITDAMRWWPEDGSRRHDRFR